MTRLPFEHHLLSGKLRGRRGWLRYFQRHEIGAVCQEAVVKNGGGFGALPGLEKTWAIVVGVLIVLFCLSYLVQHPATVDQTSRRSLRSYGRAGAARRLCVRSQKRLLH